MEDKQRKGYTWIATSSGGFWVKESSGSKHSHQLSIFCPHCRKISGTIDDEFLLEYGFCKICHTMHVDERKVPTIDIEYYKNLRNK